MKLQKMTDFVLEHPATTDYEWQLSRHLKYAQFLQQPLTFGMFVPLCENGKVLEEPRQEKYGWFSATHPEEESGWMYEEGESKYYESIKDWDKAKEKILFKFDFNVRYELTEQFSTIEDLANFYEPELTTSAVKQIGL